MGTKQTLADVMNAMSASLDVVMNAPAPKANLSEMEAFALNDKILASLRKQYLDARAMRLQTQKQYGADDGMTELAILNEDSAWCAMQTRYLELRDNQEAVGAAQAAMEQAEYLEQQRTQKEEDQKTMAYYRAMQMIQKTREREKADYAMLIFALLMLKDTYKSFFRMQTCHQFNYMAA